ncbi:MAG TPA: zf-HC2 domain-containing protein [Marmoricola sp.]|nr:zf-HC2 domain-containing protein [Marmoricola sp.]
MTTPHTTWHADDDLLAAYVAGELDPIGGASVEQHLTRCAECRVRIRPLVDVPALDRTWLAIRDTVQSPVLPLPIRVARRLGLPEPTSVLLAATASLRTAWLASAVVALAFAVLAAAWSSDGVIAPFLLVAPLIPVLGVAAAYGPHEDPLESLVVTAPYGRTRLILLRTLAVLASALPVAVPLGFLLPGPVWLAVAWLGPALALVPVLLALASFVGPRAAGATVAIGWSAVVLGSLRPLPATWPVEATQQVVYLGLAALAGVVLYVRTRHDRQIGAVL